MCTANVLPDENALFGDLNYVNPDAPACAQILIVMFEYFGFEITKDIATCIITGIITDTGGFAYSGVTAETFEFAASLLKRGVNVSDVYKRVLQTTTKPCFELTRIALNRLEFLENGKISFTYITEEDMQKANAETGDHEGIVTIGRNIEGVEVSVFARQIDEGWRLSLRSNDYVNVSDVCIMFGGGGHPKAAGATLTGSIDEVKDKILAPFKLLARGGGKNPTIITKTIREATEAKGKKLMSDLDMPVFIPTMDITEKKTVYYTSRMIKNEECYMDYQKSKMTRVTVWFNLDKDKDIISWLDKSETSKSEMIKKALRNEMNRNEGNL